MPDPATGAALGLSTNFALEVRPESLNVRDKSISLLPLTTENFSGCNACFLQNSPSPSAIVLFGFIGIAILRAPYSKCNDDILVHAVAK